MGFCVASTKNGSSRRWRTRPTVTWRSCMASSSAACVLGGVRLISSARMTLANSGPWRNLNSRWPVERFSSITSVPVMSEGIRSGVNWMRLKASDSDRDSVLIISVLASPGTPSRMQWPRLKRAMSSSSMTWSWPTMTRLSCCLMLSKAARSRLTDSRSSCRRSSVGPWAAWPSIARDGLIAWSLMRISSFCTREDGTSTTGARLLLVYGQHVVIQLEDGQVDGGDEDGADVAAAPAAVAVLGTQQVVEGGLAVLAPRQALGLPRFREEPGVALVAEHVDGLGEVVVGV